MENTNGEKVISKTNWKIQDNQTIPSKQTAGSARSDSDDPGLNKLGSDDLAVHKEQDVQEARKQEQLIEKVSQRIAERSHIRTHYYVKIVVSSFLCALLLSFGIPVFVASRLTGSLSYTALGAVLIVFGLTLAIAVIVMLFKPPWDRNKS